MLTKTTKILSLSALAFAASFAALPAAAAPGETVSVQIHKADLMSEAGTARIYYRLKQTARAACHVSDGRMSIKQKVAAEACAARLMDSFVTQVRSARMRALHKSKTALSG